MKKIFYKSFLSIVLIAFLLVTVVPLGSINSSAADIKFSDSYMNGIYYERLMNVSLSGNQIDDIVNIGLSQEGYTSGDYRDLSGMSTKKENYTEYGAAIGENPNNWCAYFVSWCARLAGVSDDVIPNFSGCTTATNNFRDREKWGSGGTWHDGYVLNSNSTYIPQKGDLVFYSWYQNYPEDPKSVDHVGIVTQDSTTNSCVYTIEGNTSDKVAQKKLTPDNGSKYSNTKYVVGYFSPNYNNNTSGLGVLDIISPKNLEYLNPTVPGKVTWNNFDGAQSYRYTIREQKYNPKTGGYIDTDNYLCSRVLTTSTSFSLDKNVNSKLMDYVKSQCAYKIWVGAHSDDAGNDLIAERIITVCMETQTTETPDLINPYIQKEYYSQDLYTGTYSGLVPIDKSLTILWEDTGDYYKIAVKALDGTPCPSENEEGTVLISYHETTENSVSISESVLKKYAGKYIKVAINSVEYACDNAISANYYFKLECEPIVEDEPTIETPSENVNIKFERDIYEVPLYNEQGKKSSDFTVRFVDLETSYTVHWEINNSNVAKIVKSSLNECRVSVVSAGTTTLTATVSVNGRLYEKSCTIKITDDEDEPTTGDEPVNIDISFEKDVYEVPLRDANGDPTPAFYVVFADLDVDYTTSWEIDNSNIAKINYSNKNECVVSAVSAGTTTLTVTVEANGRLYEKSCTIKVTGDEDEPTIGDDPTGFTLSYDANGGSGAPVSQSGASSYKVSDVQPVRGGYTFLGWSTEPDATSARYTAGSNISSFDNVNITLYAVWQKKSGCSVTISETYIEVVAPEGDDPFGGEQSSEIIISSVPAGNDIDIYVEDTSVANVSQVRYKGEDFYRAVVYGLKPGETYLVAEMMCDGLKYTAKSRIKVLAPEIDEPTGFTLSYDANGGSGAPVSQSGASSYKVSDVQPVRSGYTFLGWSTEPDATSARYTAGSNISSFDNFDVTLYAVWQKVEEEPKIAVSCKIISEPVKTNYIYLGAMQADLTGLILEITYSDGTKETITDTSEIAVKGFDTISVGSKIVTLEYSGVSAQFVVNVSYTWWQWIIRILLFGWLWY